MIEPALDRRGGGSVRSTRPKKKHTVADDFAEEMISGLLCQVEDPEDNLNRKQSKKNKKQKNGGGILRPPGQFLRKRTGESTNKSVRWIDDPERTIVSLAKNGVASETSAASAEGIDEAAATASKQTSTNDDSSKSTNSDNKRWAKRADNLKAGMNTIATSCMEVGIETGCMSPTTAAANTQPYHNINMAMSHESGGSSTAPMHRISRAQKHAKFDDDGNPVSTKPGFKAPPKPPPTPPPSKREIFIPQLCGVELNCIDDTTEMYARSKVHSRSIYSGADEDENSLVAGERDAELLAPTVALKKSVPSFGNAVGGKGTRSWEELRNRLEAASENDWDGPDWMENDIQKDSIPRNTTSSADDESETQERYSTVGEDTPDPISQDRSDVGEPKIQEDDWDNSLPIVPGSQRQVPNRRSGANNNLQPVQEYDDESMQEKSRDTSMHLDIQPPPPPPPPPLNQQPQPQKRMLPMFGLKNRKGRDPSPGRSLLRGSSTPKSDTSGPFSEVLDEDKASQASSSRPPAENWRQRSANILRRSNNNNSNANSAANSETSVATRSSTRSRSKSPSRLKRMLDGITTFSPTNKKSNSMREFESTDPAQENNDFAPMPHLHPAHPLNQVRSSIQAHNGDGTNDPERQINIMAHRNGFGDGIASERVASDTDDRMSYITAHRELVDGSQTDAVAASTADQDDRMSFITAHRQLVDKEQVTLDQRDDDDRMSFITAHRQHIDGVQTPPATTISQNNRAGSGAAPAVNNDADKQSYIGAHRNMMEPSSPKQRTFRVPSPREMLRRRSQQQQQQQQTGKKVEYREIQTQTSLDIGGPINSPVQSLVAKAPSPVAQTSTTENNPKADERQDVDVTTTTEDSKEKKKNEDPKWEERTRLAWERIRSNGFGATLSASSRKQKSEQTAAASKTEGAEVKSLSLDGDKPEKTDGLPQKLDLKQEGGEHPETVERTLGLSPKHSPGPHEAGSGGDGGTDSKRFYLPHLLSPKRDKSPKNAQSTPSHESFDLHEAGSGGDVGTGSKPRRFYLPHLLSPRKDKSPKNGQSSIYYMPKLPASQSMSSGEARQTNEASSRPLKGILKATTPKKRVHFVGGEEEGADENIPPPPPSPLQEVQSSATYETTPDEDEYEMVASSSSEAEKPEKSAEENEKTGSGSTPSTTPHTAAGQIPLGDSTKTELNAPVEPKQKITFRGLNIFSSVLLGKKSKSKSSKFTESSGKAQESRQQTATSQHVETVSSMPDENKKSKSKSSRFIESFGKAQAQEESRQSPVTSRQAETLSSIMPDENERVLPHVQTQPLNGGDQQPPVSDSRPNPAEPQIFAHPRVLLGQPPAGSASPQPPRIMPIQHPYGLASIDDGQQAANNPGWAPTLNQPPATSRQVETQFSTPDKNQRVSSHLQTQHSGGSAQLPSISDSPNPAEPQRFVAHPHVLSQSPTGSVVSPQPPMMPMQQHLNGFTYISELQTTNNNPGGAAPMLYLPNTHPGGAPMVYPPNNHPGGAPMLYPPNSHPGGAPMLYPPNNHPRGAAPMYQAVYQPYTGGGGGIDPFGRPARSVVQSETQKSRFSFRGKGKGKNKVARSQSPSGDDPIVALSPTGEMVYLKAPQPQRIAIPTYQQQQQQQGYIYSHQPLYAYINPTQPPPPPAGGGYFFPAPQPGGYGPIMMPPAQQQQQQQQNQYQGGVPIPPYQGQLQQNLPPPPPPPAAPPVAEDEQRRRRRDAPLASAATTTTTTTTTTAAPNNKNQSQEQQQQTEEEEDDDSERSMINVASQSPNLMKNGGCIPQICS